MSLIVHSMVGQYVSKGRKTVQLAMENLKPIVEDRLAKMEEYGEDWTEKPVCPSPDPRKTPSTLKIYHRMISFSGSLIIPDWTIAQCIW